MSREFDNLEKVFRETLSDRIEAPSPNVLRKLKRRLWISDFFGFNPRKINFVYTTAVLAGMSVFMLNTMDTNIENTAYEPDLSEANAEQITISDKVELNDELLASAGEITEAIPEKSTMNITRAILSARFDAPALEGCAPYTVRFSNKSVAASSWKWDFGNGKLSSEQNPRITYTNPGTYTVTLTVKGKNKETATHIEKIKVLPSPTADLDIDIEKSDMAMRKVLFKNKSKGAEKYTWNFGDKELKSGEVTEYTYADFGVYPVKLIAKAQNGCTDTVLLVNKFLEHDYTLSFPLNFRPNPYNRNNGYYETAGSESGIFYPRNAGVKDYQLKIFTPNGTEVFSTNDIKKGWNGYMRGRLAPPGYYRYEAEGSYPNGKSFLYKSTVRVIVDQQDYY